MSLPPSGGRQQGAQQPSRSVWRATPSSTSWQDAVRARTALIARERKEVFDFLSSSECQLFSQVEGAIPLTEADLDVLLAAGGTSSTTLAHLRYLNSLEKKFYGFNDLIPAVQALRVSRSWVPGSAPGGSSSVEHKQPQSSSPNRWALPRVKRSNAVNPAEEDAKRLRDLDRQKLLEYLSSGQCKLFSAAKEIKAVGSELDRAVEEGGTVDETIALLKELDIGDFKFHKFATLILAIRQAREDKAKRLLEVDAQRQRLFKYLVSPSCRLFTAAKGQVQATGAELDRLVRAAGSVEDAIRLLRNLDEVNRKFSRFQDVFGALEDARAVDRKKARDKALQSIRESVLDFLSSPECEFFDDGEDLVIQHSELNKLLEVGGSMTLFNLRFLNDAGRKFESFTHVVYAVKALRQKEKTCKRDLYEFCTHPDCVLFKVEAQVHTTPVDIERLYVEGHAGPDTLAHLEQLEADGQVFESHDHLIEAVRNAHQASVEARLRKKEVAVEMARRRKRVIQFLSKDTCTLFSDDVEDVHVKRVDLDKLIQVGGGVDNTLYHLQSLNAQHKEFTSFVQLIPEVASLQEETLRVKEELLARLTDPQCPLIHTGEVVVNEADVDRLFEESGAGVHTMSHVDQLEHDGQRFDYFDDVIVAVKLAEEERVKERERKLADEEVKELISLEEVERQRKAVLAYLSGRSCQLFSEADEIKVSDKDLDDLLLAGGSLPSLLAHLKHLNAYGAKFDSYDELHGGVLRAKAAADDHIAQLLLYMRSEECGLFSEIYDTDWTQDDVQRLFNQGHAATSTLSYLRDFDGRGRKFVALDDLIEAVYAAHVLALETMRAESAAIRGHLTGPKCNLFYDAVEVPDRLVSQLLEAGAGGSATLMHLQELDRAGRKFESVDELIPAVRDARMSLDERKREVFRYFTGPKCSILHPICPPVTEREVEQLFEEGGAAAQTLVYLWSFETGNRQFRSVADVIVAVKKAHIESVERQRSERYMLITHLQGSGCNLFDDRVVATDDDLDKLIKAGGGGSSTLYHLEELDSAGYRFSSFEDLISAVRAAEADSIDRKESMLAKLTSSSSRLFAATSQGVVDSLSMADMNVLFSVGRDPRRTQYYVEVFEANGEEFHSFEELVAAVKEADRRTMDTLREEKWMIEAHLSSDECSLLLPDAVINDADLDRLFKVGGSGPAILFHLKRLEEQGDQFRSMAELTVAVRDAHVSTLDRKTEILEHFQNSQCQLFSNVPGGLKVTTDDVDVLFAEGGAGPETLIHLWAFDSAGRKFDSFDELVAAVKATHSSSLERSKEERMMLLAHLSRKKCQLLRGTMRATPEDLDKLCDAGRSAPDSLFFLAQLESDGRTFSRFSDLIEAVEEQYNLSLVVKNQVLKYLQSWDCKLFSSSPYPVKVTAASADRLYKKGRAGPLTLQYVQYLNRSGGQSFNAFDELIEAVKGVHLDEHQKRMAARHYQASQQAREENMQLERKLRDEETEEQRRQETERIRRQHKEEQRLRRKRAGRTGVRDDGTVEDEFGDEKHPSADYDEDLSEDMADDIGDDPIREAVVDYLRHPDRKFFVMAPQIEITEEDLERLFAEGRRPASTLLYLEFLDLDGRKFQTFDGLVSAVKRVDIEHMAVKREILTFLTNPDKCSLFGSETDHKNDVDNTQKDPVARGGVAELKLTLEDMDILFEVGRAGPFTKSYIYGMAEEGRRFSSIVQLARAVRDLHVSRRDRIVSEKLMLFKNLKASPLFAKECPCSDASLDKLLAEARTGVACLSYLKNLQESGRKFNDFSELLEAVCVERDQAVSSKQAVFKYLNEGRHMLFSLAPTDVTVSKQQVERLYEDAGRDFTLKILHEFDEQQQQRFASFQELHLATKKAYLQRMQMRHQENLVLIDKLKEYSLFTVTQALSHQDLESLYRAGGGGRANDRDVVECLFHLARMYEQGEKFENFEQLAEGMSRAVAQAKQDRLRLYHLLRHGRCQVFEDPSYSATITPAKILKFYRDSEAGSHCLPVVEAFDDDSKQRYENLKELADAVRAAAALRKRDRMDQNTLAQMARRQEAIARGEAVSGGTGDGMEGVDGQDDDGDLSEPEGGVTMLNKRFDDVGTREDDGRSEDMVRVAGDTLQPSRGDAEQDAGGVGEVKSAQKVLPGDVGLRSEPIPAHIWQPLFSKVQGIVHVSDAEMQRLIDGAGSRAQTMEILKWLDEEGFRANKFSQLLPAVRQALKKSHIRKQKILQWVNSTDCHLFHDADVHELVEDDVDRLFELGLAKPAALPILLDLDSQERRFSSVEELSEALKAATIQYTEAMRKAKRVLMMHLHQPQRALFKTPAAYRQYEVDRVMAQKQALSGGSTALVLAGFFHALQLEADEQTFSSLQELGEAIEYSHRNDKLFQRRLYEYLTRTGPWAGDLQDQKTNLGEPCDLFGTFGVKVTRRRTIRLYQRSRAGPVAEVTCRSFDEDGRKFASLQELAIAVNEARINSHDGIHLGTDIALVYQYLLSPMCTIIDPSLRMQRRMVRELLESCGSSASAAIMYLMQLGADGHTFSDFRVLLDSIRSIHKRVAEDKSEILQFLQSRQECQLFGRSNTRVHIDRNAVQYLYEVSGAGEKTLYLLQQLNKDGMSFHAFEDLVAAVYNQHMAFLAENKRKADEALYERMRSQAESAQRIEEAKSQVVAAASDETALRRKEAAVDAQPDFEDKTEPPTPTEQDRRVMAHFLQHCELFSEATDGFDVTRQQLNELLCASKVGMKGVLLRCRYLDENGVKFNDFDQLIDHVSEQELRMLPAKQSCLKYLRSDVCQFFATLPNAEALVQSLTLEDMHQLFVDAQGLEHTFSVVKMLNRKGTLLYSFDELTAAVRRLNQDLQLQAREAQLMIWTHLHQPENSVMTTAAPVARRDVSALFTPGGAESDDRTAAGVLFFLLHLCKSVQHGEIEPFRSFRLVAESYVKEKGAQIQEIVQFMRSRGTALVRNPDEVGAFNPQFALYLWDTGTAGYDTLGHVYALYGSKQQFDSVKELAQAIHSVHLEHLEGTRHGVMLELAIMVYLYSSACKVSIDGFEDGRSFLSRSQVRQLVAAAGGSSAATLYYLHLLGTSVEEAQDQKDGAVAQTSGGLVHGGRLVFDTWESLVAAVRKQDREAVEQKDALLQYLKDPICALFSERRSSQPVQLTPERIHELWLLGAGRFTLSFCQELDNAWNKFDTLDDLIAAVALLNMQALTAKRSKRHRITNNDRVQVMEYFDRPSCLLFNDASDMKSIAEDIQSKVDELFRASQGGGPLTTLLLNTLNEDFARFEDYGGLVDAVDDEAAVLSSTKKSLLSRLSDPLTLLWTRPDLICRSLRMADVSELVELSTAGAKTVAVLERLEAICRARDFNERSGRKQRLSAYISGLNEEETKIGFLGELAAVEWGVELEAVPCVDVPELTALARKVHLRAMRDRQAVVRALTRFLTAKRCQLFPDISSGSAALGGYLHRALKGTEVRDLLAAVQGASYALLFELQRLNSNLSVTGTYETVRDVAAAVRRGRSESLALQKRDRIVDFLLSPECVLLADGVLVTEERVDRLFCQYGLGAALLSKLKDLNAEFTKEQRPPLTSFRALMVAIPVDIESSDEVARAIASYLHSPSCHLFEDCKETLEVHRDELNGLLNAGKGLARTLDALEQLDEVSRRFMRFSDLQDAVFRFFREGSAVTEEMRQDVLKFFHSKTCHLFEGRNLEISRMELDDLVQAGQGIVGTLEALRTLNEGNQKYSDIDSLIYAVQWGYTTKFPLGQTVSGSVVRETLLGGPSGSEEKVSGVTMEDLQRVAGFIQETELFKAMEKDLVLSGSDLEELITAGGGVDGCLACLGRIGNRGLVFASFQDMVAAVEDEAKLENISEVDKERVVVYLRNKATIFEDVEDLQVEENHMVALIRAGRGADRTLHHLQRFDDVFRRFTSFEELIKATTEADITEGHLSQVALDKLQQTIAATALFSDLVEGQQVNATAEDMDLLVAEAGGVNNARDRLRSLDRAGRKVVSFPALIAAVRDCPVFSVEEHTAVINALQDAELFEDDRLQVTAHDLNALLINGGGLDKTRGHLAMFNKMNRVFKSFPALVENTKAAAETGAHLSDLVQEDIAAFLDSADMFSKSVDISIADIESLIVMCDGVDNLKKWSSTLSQRVGSVEELRSALSDAIAASKREWEDTVDEAKKPEEPVEYVDQDPDDFKDLAISHEQRGALVEMLSQEEFDVFLDMEDMEVEASMVDALLRAAGTTDIAQLGRIFTRLTQQGVKVGDMPALVDPVRQTRRTLKKEDWEQAMARESGREVTQSDVEALRKWISEDHFILSSGVGVMEAVTLEGVEPLIRLAEKELADSKEKEGDVRTPLSLVKDHIAQYAKAGRTFPHLQALRVDLAGLLESAPRGSYISDKARQRLVSMLPSLMEEQDDMQVEGGDLDQVLYAGDGEKTAFEHLKVLARVRRLFPDLKSLSSALEQIVTHNGSYATESMMQEIAEFLGENEMFTSEFEVSPVDLDQLLIAGNGLEMCKLVCRSLKLAGSTFDSVSQCSQTVGEYYERNQEELDAQLIRDQRSRQSDEAGGGGGEGAEEGGEAGGDEEKKE